MFITFHGGTRETTTGACHLLETDSIKLLIDCGMFQGCEECPDLNQDPFLFDPSLVDALIVTHAHIDHVGRIPKLVQDGFKGIIYSTAATRELSLILLEDARGLAEKQNGFIFSEEDIKKSAGLWKDLPYHEEIAMGDVKIKLLNAGHILGSAMVELEAEGKHIVFTGDLGNEPSVLLPPRDPVSGADYLIIESTYGARVHESPEERILKLERSLEDISFRKGVLMIPAFATERTQDILFLLNEMTHFKRVPIMPIFVDSPLAIRITEVFERHPKLYKEEIRELYIKHPHLFQFKNLHFTPSVEESKHINDVPSPKVIIAGSGMLTGGRILHHTKRYLSDPQSMLLVVGYQAAGSLGRRLIDGAKKVRVLHDEVLVEAEIRKINGFSAHADGPQLFSLVESLRDTLKRVFVVQGEEAQALHLQQEIRDRLGIHADAPFLHQKFEI